MASMDQFGRQEKLWKIIKFFTNQWLKISVVAKEVFFSIPCSMDMSNIEYEEYFFKSAVVMLSYRHGRLHWLSRLGNPWSRQCRYMIVYLYMNTLYIGHAGWFFLRMRYLNFLLMKITISSLMKTIPVIQEHGSWGNNVLGLSIKDKTPSKGRFFEHL